MTAGQACNRGCTVHSESGKEADCAGVVHAECAGLSVQVRVDGYGAVEVVWLEKSAVRVLYLIPVTHVTISFEGERQWADSVTLSVLLYGL